ncbi:MAG: SDR family NAD(P)-dependent oxidoreductase [Desulfobacterales bacterium]|nr:SDR family NAD(P)-dependent oxidoreductase [Desulfobacterales bacterium]
MDNQYKLLYKKINSEDTVTKLYKQINEEKINSDDAVTQLYKQIKEKIISPDDAVKQFKLLAIQNEDEIIHSLSLWNGNPAVPEIYIYDEPYLHDHTVYDEQVVVGVTHASLAINAFFNIFPAESSVHLHKLTFFKPIEVKKDQQVEVIVDSIEKGSGTDFQVLYRHAISETWNLTATGSLQKTILDHQEIDVENIKESLTEFNDINQIYTRNSVVGMGPSFRTISQLYTGKDQVLARVALSKTSLEENHKYVLHPLIINSAFLSLSPLLIHMGNNEGFLPFGIKNIFFKKNIADGIELCWLLVKLVKNSGELIIFDADVINDESQVIANFTGCSLKRFRSVSQGVANGYETSVLTEQQPQRLEFNNQIDIDSIEKVADLSEKIQKYLINKLGKIVSDRSNLSNLNVNLIELGVESIQLVEMANDIEKETKIEIYPTLFFEYPNIKELTEYFTKEHRDSFIHLFGIISKKAKVSNAVNKTLEITSLKEVQESSRPTDTGLKKVKLLQKSSSLKPSNSNDIAVIGMDGNFAEASNLKQFWNNLCDKKDLMKEIPLDHWDYRPWYNENSSTNNMTYCKWGSFIDDVDKFDAAFFNISPREAEWMDPQLRLLLQSIYATGEDAGYINQLRSTNTGVFVGVCFQDYAGKIAEMNFPVDPYTGSGNASTVIANRVSFIFDFTGPSIAVDTACSSSLVALHNACQALQNEECDMAFVGGVNLLLSSVHYRYFSSIGALSPTGRCHTFDEVADGYTPGECIASILLKPLDHAKKDGDQIYAIIKGSSALHGGHTPSFTAPSVAGEENVIVKAWEAAGIHPETIGYIEAHGTGTKLGDPIEINSLKNAFKRFTKKEQFCAIGSAKANIGHAEGAAGIVGLLKVILQMKHQQIPALPFFKTLNPYIQLDKSPLYINSEHEEWKSPEGVPRRAGISSFGFSGAYAHVVVEEYISENPVQHQIPVTNENPALIVLSAKNEDRLKNQAKQLLEAITERGFYDKNLTDIAYTLQVEREAMEERLAMSVVSIKDLEEKLNGFLDGSDDDIYRGQIKRNKDILSVFTADEDMGKIIDVWIIKRKYTKLLNLWVKGLIFDWNKLYGEAKPSHISLPTYPFARKRYWIPDNTTSTGDIVIASYLHPLLQQNTSDFSEQRFSSTFTGQEFFLVDHVVRGQRILPGVAYLEMAYAAVERATGALEDSNVRIRLKDVVWIRPFVVGDQPAQLHIELSPNESGEVIYEIYSKSKETNAEKIVHSQGLAQINTITEVPTLDIESLKEECSDNIFSSDQCYKTFKNIDINYGVAFQGVEKIYTGLGKVLAKLHLPSSVSDTLNQYTLHPAIMDSAIQASIGLILGIDKENFEPALAYALNKIEIFSKCTSQMWVFIKPSENFEKDGLVQKIDIELCDEYGNICVQIKDFSSRLLKDNISNQSGFISQKTAKQVENFILTPVWEPISVKKESFLPLPTQKIVIVGGSNHEKAVGELYINAHKLDLQRDVSIADITEKISSFHSIDHIVWITPEIHFKLTDDRLISEHNNEALKMYRMIKSLLNLGYKEKELGWSIITVQTQKVCNNDIVNPLYAGLHGIAGSMAKEYPNWKVRICDIEENFDLPLADIFTLPANPEGNGWGWRKNEWYKQQMIPISQPPVKHEIYREGGVYVVVGGAGGIGEAWSEYMIRTYKAQIVWIGRREKDSVINKKMEKLSASGPSPFYISADATDHKQLQRAKEEIKSEFTEINGVIHSAMVLSDSTFAEMKEEQFITSLSSKVDVSVNITSTFHNEPLDFLLFFSSINSFLKEKGSSAYAAGCSFNDAFAYQLSLELPFPVKNVNWGYWNRDISADSSDNEKYQEFQNWMAMKGTGFIEPNEGIDIIKTLLSGAVNQVVYMKTTKPSGMKGINLVHDELITIYPEKRSSNIKSIQNYILKQDTQRKTVTIDPQINELNSFLCRFLWLQLQSIGLFTEKSLIADTLNTEGKLNSLYDRWFQESIAILTRENYLSNSDDDLTIINNNQVDIDTLWKEWDEKKISWLENPDIQAKVGLVETTIRALPEILTAKVLATDILFPDSSMELVEGIYKNNPIADFFNDVLSDAVIGYIKERLKQNPSSEIKILEIGAGTGGTSAVVFSKLKPFENSMKEYCYTDLSKAFLIHAEKEYGAENPYITGQIFNVEQPVDQQSIQTDAYDIVIAANVLHATKNIRQTLRNAKAVLKKNGLILLNEMSCNNMFFHLTFGLLKGWWLYEDSSLRIPGCPGLYSETWKNVMETEGFQNVFYPAHRDHGMGQQIIIGESDGIVRQKKQQLKSVSEQKIGEEAIKVKGKQIQKSQNKGAQSRNTEEFVNKFITKKLAKTLKVLSSDIDGDQPIADYGLDSILVATFINELKKEFDVDLNTTVIFDYSTVDKLSDYILKTYGDKIESHILKKISERKTIKKSIEVTGKSKQKSQSKGTQSRNVEECLKKIITKKLSDALKVLPEDIDGDQPIADYGLDSILVVTFIKELKKAFDVDLNTTIIFDYSTIDKLSAYLLKTHGEKIESHILKNKTVQNKKNTPLYVQEEEEINTSVLSINENRFLKKIKPSVNKDITTSIAVTGISGQFPGAEDIDAFWHNLVNGVDGVQELPPEYLDQKKFYNKKKHSGKTYCKWGGILKEKNCFDPLFFNLSPREAESMNPHQRLILQESWGALEDAGYNPGDLSGSMTGIFIGAEPSGYMHETFTGSSEAIVASRLSYFLDLSGPALVVNTGCSSSGVAIHLACESLRNNETSLALAGGVFATLDHAMLSILSEIEMLSYSGRCRTFDESGDGTVLSEGVGVVVLKRLNDAIYDGDNIYGIIEASGTNQDGASNGITAPSGIAQERLITDVYKRYSINPEDITYAEVHGTGTKLGDPVEANSLVRAFKQFTDKNNFCAVGSSKSHIGHTAAAAGVTGLIKILLSIRHHKIPGLIHFNKLNPLIELENSAFYMNTELSEWRSENSKPLKAVLNSFGHSGTNVHLVVQEYIPPKDNLSNSHIINENHVVVISAKNEERLKAYASKFVRFLKKFPETDMKKLTFTLQTGREAMARRLAVVSTNTVVLSEKLARYCKGESNIENLYTGNFKTDRGKNDILVSGSAGEQFINNVVEEGEFNKVAQLWVSGIEIDWNLFYPSEEPSRISLPTYPFAKERYWKPTTATENPTQEACASVSKLHPLLHQNTSNIEEQRYSSTFTGEEFFLSDHVVKGQGVLPGVAYLEMARVAIEHATLREGDTGILLKDVVWIRPITVGDEEAQVHIGLFPEDNGEIAFKIYSDSGEDNVITYSQGKAVLCNSAGTTTLDIKTIQKECNRTILSPAQCYEAFKSAGIEYGPGHQGIDKVYIGENQVFSKLVLPSTVSDTKDQYVLHPGMLDSALQSSIGFIIGSLDTDNTAQGKPALPFTLQELEIHSNCTDNMWAWLRYSTGSSAEDRIQKLDIDLCDESGNVCVRMKGLSARVLEGDIETESQIEAIENPPQPKADLATLIPVWDSVSVEKGEQFPSQADQVLVIGDNNENTIWQMYPKAQAIEIGGSDSVANIAEKLNNCGVVDHIVWIAPHNPLESLTDEALIEEQNCGVLLLFRMIKALHNLGYGARSLGWSVVTIQVQSVCKNDVVNPSHSSIHGLIGSMAKEYHNWKIRLVDLETDCEWPLDEIFKMKTDPLGNARAYRGHEWYRQQLIPLNSPITSDVTSYKNDGVYVVIGGAGGIGEVWSEYMIRSYNAQIIWIGRREKDTGIQAKLNKLANLGPVPLYISADATDLKSLQRAYEKIKQYSKINGIIHSAIVLSDKSLANMEEEQFKSSLSAKVDVSVRMAQVFKKESLDFLMFFSAFQSFAKSPGQSNYAAGCIFKDTFAKQLSKELPCAVKIINWGYWGSVGIVASKDYQDRMEMAGFGSIEPFEGMEALEELLTGQMDQTVFMKITKPKVMEEIGSDELITIGSENGSINIQSIYNNIPKHDLQLKRIEESMSQIKTMNELLCRLLCAQLQSIGLFTKNNLGITDLKTTIKLPDLYDRWLEESIRVLKLENYITCSENLYSVIDKPAVDISTIWKEWDEQKEIWLENHDMLAKVNLVETTIRALPEILTGKVPATDIMFPDSSMKLVEGIYKQNLIADYYNEVLADTVVTYIQKRIELDESAKIRILEIGAGTGGTSAVVFSKIKPYSEHIEEYCYTDLSKAFLMHAEEEFGHDNPYLIGKIFNVEKNLERQGIKAGNYDIVIAANVLHATKNIRQTLRNAKAALKKNGFVLLNEISSNNLFVHLTFGLLEGWWLSEDPALRIQGSPGLLPEAWKNVLETEGFGSIFFPEQESHGFGQQIVVAKSDGVIRQKQLNKPAMAPIKQNVKVKTLKKLSSEQKLPTAQAGKITDEVLWDKSILYLKKMIGETLKIPSHKIDSTELLDKYGIDSILAVQLTNNLSTVLDNVNTTLFFEYQTIDALTGYFIKTQKDSLIKLIDEQQLVEEVSTKEKIYPKPSLVTPQRISRKSRASKKLNDLENTRSESPFPNVQDVAIIGMSGRFPMSKDLNEFWNNIVDGKDCITEIPIERWDWREYYGDPSEENNKTHVKWGGFITDVDKFDPLFFRISPKEARSLDPQLRLMLMYVWKAIEDAGISPKRLSHDRTGIFITAANNEYANFVLSNSDNKNISVTGLVSSMIPNRISHTLNLQGPSEYCDTACSSTFVALHRAIQSIKNNECEQAIVGAVNLILSPMPFTVLESQGYLSLKGQAKSFQEDADGLVRSEGVGALIIKPLQKAIENQDNIYAVVRGTGVAHGGRGLSTTAPNAKGMKAAMKQAYQSANIDPRTISFIETHGMGSPLTDAIEINALKTGFHDIANSLFSMNPPTENPCYISSLKPIIGHGEFVSGMAELIKVVFSIRNKVIPGISGFTKLHEQISLNESTFAITAENHNWDSLQDSDGYNTPRRASINSFGLSGVNTHVIIEEYIESNDEQNINISTNSQIIVFSAKTPDSLYVLVQQMLDFVEQQVELPLSNLAFTLQSGREAMECRLSIVVQNKEDLIKYMKEYLESSKNENNSLSVFSSNLKDKNFKINELLEGNIAKAVLDILILEKNLKKIASLWVQGFDIPWKQLHEGNHVRVMSLPTYPFERQRYWVDSKVEFNLVDEKDKSLKKNSHSNGNSNLSTKNKVIAILSPMLDISPSKLNKNTPLETYGFDSILLLQLLRQLQNQINKSIDLLHLKECKTILDIIKVIELQPNDKLLVQEKENIDIKTNWPQFPELYHLNKSLVGRPVFWIHGGLGGVEVYIDLALSIQRPFFGIQSKGWMSERVPIHGIKAMAEYYVSIIQSVQPEGPYDIGGYSLGGIISYEIAFQLQKLGQTVSSIVMIDSTDSPVELVEPIEPTEPTDQDGNLIIYGIINYLLLGRINNGEEISLIHRDELNFNMTSDEFFKQLFGCVRAHGVKLNQTDDDLRSVIKKSINVQSDYGVNDYLNVPFPILPNPQEVMCYYFRNKSGSFFGELEPYFFIKNFISPVNYWKEWEKLLPNFSLIDVESSNHFQILNEAKSSEAILDFCKTLYVQPDETCVSIK